MCSAIFLYQGRKRDIYHEKVLMYGFASLWFTIGLARIFFYFSDYIVEGTYTGDINSIFQEAAATNSLLQIIIYYFYMYFYIYLYVNVIVVCFMFIWFSIRLKVQFQAISSMMAIGFTVFLIGWTFEAIAIKELQFISPGISSVLVMVGVIIAVSPLVLEFEFFSRALANWIILAIIGFIGVFLASTLIFNLETITLLLVMIWFFAILLASVVIYMIVYFIKSSKAPKPRKEELQEALRLFTRRQKFTEEEVAYFKEKKICLVCKGHVSRLSYICPGCDALYCTKCSGALSDLENACWVCETPFDETKAVHIVREERLLETEEAMIEESIDEGKKLLKKHKSDFKEN